MKIMLLLPPLGGITSVKTYEWPCCFCHHYNHVCVVRWNFDTPKTWMSPIRLEGHCTCHIAHKTNLTQTDISVCGPCSQWFFPFGQFPPQSVVVRSRAMGIVTSWDMNPPDLIQILCWYLSDHISGSSESVSARVLLGFIRLILSGLWLTNPLF